MPSGDLSWLQRRNLGRRVASLLGRQNVERAILPVAQFIHIPKTAGTTLLRWIDREIGVWSIVSNDFSKISPAPPGRFVLYTGHLHPDKPIHLHLFTPSELRKVPSFTFVRNPYTRALSLYLHFQRHSPFEGTLSDFLAVVEGDAGDCTPKVAQRIRQMSRPQKYWIRRRRGLRIENVFQVEHFDSSVSKVAQLLGISSAPQKSDFSQVNKSGLRLSVEHRERIMQLYSEDFGDLGYPVDS